MDGFIRKMCILKQLTKGFSADGSPVGGVVRVQTFASQATVQLSLINFAAVEEGKYVCVICDKQGERLLFPVENNPCTVTQENCFLHPDGGFCCLICFVRDELQVVAAGQSGGGSYSLKLLTQGLLPSPTPTPKKEEEREPPPPERQVIFEKDKEYNDEACAEENYYEQAQRRMENEMEDEPYQEQEPPQAQGSSPAKDEDALFGEQSETGESYYHKIKDELESIFLNGERTNVLCKAFPGSEWVKVVQADGCLVGVIYENWQIKYIAYALPATQKKLSANLDKAYYVPVDAYHPNNGYFVVFQDAVTGECVKLR